MTSKSSERRNPKSPAWNYDWDSATWVHLHTRTKSRPEYVGFVDEDEGPHVYLLRPTILTPQGKWIDSWTWRERIGPLPELKPPHEFFGEVIVYKWDVLDIQEIEYPGEIDRCWFCGNKIPSGRFCEPRHEYVFRRMDLDKEMLEPNDGYRGRWTRRDSLLDFERLFDIKTLGYELKKTKAKTRDKFGAKIDLISQIIRLQTRLSGIYTQQCMTKEEIGLGSNENYVLRNTIGNQPYRSLSALMLIRNTFYGSARPIIRQFFESLMIAKYAEYDPAVATRWHDQDESKPESQVNLSDVLRPLNKIGKKNTRLRETWRVLCAMTHATRVSQQVLRLPDPAKPEDVTKLLDTSQYFENTEYSLDLLFLVLATNFHLITVFLAKKAEGWWFGDRQDAYGSFKREKTLTKSINSLIQQYLDDTMLNLPVYQMLRENLDEFEVSWNR